MLRLPKHINLTIEHQPHATHYMTVEEWLTDGAGDMLGAPSRDAITDADRQAMIDSGEVWHIRWYPIRPVGLCEVWAATLERALELMNAGEPVETGGGAS